jgi:hypothetical protein
MEVCMRNFMHVQKLIPNPDNLAWLEACKVYVLAFSKVTLLQDKEESSLHFLQGVANILQSFT